MLIQVVPLQSGLLAHLSPATDHLLRQYDFTYASGVTTRHALSVDPAATWVAIAALVSLGVLFLGVARSLGSMPAARLVPYVLGVGVVLALAAIIQKPLYAGRIYGLWTPEFSGSPFGPFVNRNHFAGWMLMALPLSVAYLCGRLEKAWHSAGADARRRLLWLGSPEGSQVLLIASSVLVMTLALVLSMSRSGIVCGVVALAAMAVRMRRRRPTSRRFVFAGLCSLLLAVPLWWASPERLATHFGSADWRQVNGRLGAARDAWTIAQTFVPYGSGVNTYGVTSLFFQTYDRTSHYVQAHNDYLQLLAEGGLLLACPAAIFLALLAQQVRRRFRGGADDDLTWWVRAGASTSLLAIALQELVDFSLQMPGNAALFAVVAAIAVHEPAGSG
jgi:O-antigen ligase